MEGDEFLVKVLISGDKHLGLVSDGMDRLEEQWRIVERTIEVLEEEKPDVFVDLGDLFHSPRPTPAAYELAFKYLTGVMKCIFDVGGYAYFLVGNHDKPTRGSVHALIPLNVICEAHPKAQVEVITLPTTRLVRGVSLWFLPFVTEWEAKEDSKNLFSSASDYLVSYVKGKFELGGSSPIVVFTHLEVPNVVGSDGETVKRDTGLCIPQLILENERVIHVYAGHEHRPQELGKVTVVGSAIHVDFGEADETKGMILAEVNS